METRHCSNCGSKISKDAKFCGNCGEEINLVEIETNSCPGCGYVGATDEKYCPECGTALTSGTNKNKTSKSQAKPAEQKKPRPVAKPTATPPVKKKKGGILRTLGKVALWIFGILIVATTILYFMGDDPDSTNPLVSTHQGKDGDPTIDMPKKAIIKETKVIAEGTIYPEDARLEADNGNVAMFFDALCLGEPIEGKISKVTIENPPEDAILNIYEFKLESMEELGGIVTLVVPYDASKIPDGRTASECVSGVYYHKELHEWIEESYTIDEDRQVVLISTTHLSPHAAKISLTKEQEWISDKFIRRISKGSPDERAMPLSVKDLMDKISPNDMEKILNSLGTFGAAATNQVLSDNVLSGLGNEGSFLGIHLEILTRSPFGKRIHDKMLKRLGNFGGALVGAQFISDIKFGKPAGVILFNTAKGLTFWQGAAVGTALGGPLGGTVATVVLSGMFLLDVTGIAPIKIPLYSNEVYHRTAAKAYELYYSEMGYSDKQWMELTQFLIKDVFEEGLTGDAYNKRYIKLLKESVTDYTEKFFKEDEKVIIKYMALAFEDVQGYLGKNSIFGYDRVYSTTDYKKNEESVKEYVEEIFNGDYNGTFTSLRDELQEKYNETLIKETIPKIMKMTSEQQYLKQLDYLRVSQQELIQMLNTTYYLYFVDRSVESSDTSRYDSYYVAPIIKKALTEYRPEKWIVHLNSRGEGQMDMKQLAYLRAEYFTEFGLYKKADYNGILNGTAKPVKTIEIGTISSNNHFMNIAGDDAKILIEGARYTNIEVAEGESKELSFTAKSEYDKTCYIIWDFGKSGKYKKDGNQSEVTHEFKAIGEHKIAASLYDAGGTKLATDIVTVEISLDQAENSFSNNCRENTYTIHYLDNKQTATFSLYTFDEVLQIAERINGKPNDDEYKISLARLVHNTYLDVTDNSFNEQNLKNIPNLSDDCFKRIVDGDLNIMFNGTHINHETGKTLLFKDGKMMRVLNKGEEKVVEGPGDYGMSNVLPDGDEAE